MFVSPWHIAFAFKQSRMYSRTSRVVLYSVAQVNICLKIIIGFCLIENMHLSLCDENIV